MKCCYSQLELHADPGIPPHTVSSQTRPPGKCPQGSAHLYEGGKAASQVLCPNRFHVSAF